MTTKDLVNAHKLKKQFQVKTATRRSDNKAATRLVAARAGPGRNDLQPELATVRRPVSALRASPTRSRETTPQLLEGVIRSFKRYGIILPIVIDRHNVIIQGHAMWEAAQQLGIETIECRVVGRHPRTAQRQRQSAPLDKEYPVGCTASASPT